MKDIQGKAASSWAHLERGEIALAVQQRETAEALMAKAPADHAAHTQEKALQALRVKILHGQDVLAAAEAWVRVAYDVYGKQMYYIHTYNHT